MLAVAYEKIQAMASQEPQADLEHVQQLEKENNIMQAQVHEARNALEALIGDHLTYHDLVAGNKDPIEAMEVMERDHTINLTKDLEFRPNIIVVTSKHDKHLVEITTFELSQKIIAILSDTPTIFTSTSPLKPISSLLSLVPTSATPTRATQSTPAL